MEDQASALMYAIELNDIGRLRMLIENCCFDPNAQDSVIKNENEWKN